MKIVTERNREKPRETERNRERLLNKTSKSTSETSKVNSETSKGTSAAIENREQTESKSRAVNSGYTYDRGIS